MAKNNRKAPSLLYLVSYALLYMAIGGALWHYRLGTDLFIFAPDPPDRQPSPEEDGVGYPCVAYRPLDKGWGGSEGNCPDNHAFFSNKDVGGERKSGPGYFVPLSGACCRLPYDDILTDQHTYSAFESCPDQWVATGGSGPCVEGCTMRCTQINTEKYMLGPETMSYYWRDPKGGRTYGRGSARQMLKEHIPIALVYAVGRLEHNLWNMDGCIGYPFGSLLTRKSRKRCDGFFYRRLLYKDGTPVRMYPECEAIDDPYTPEARCVSKDAPRVEVSPDLESRKPRDRQFR